MKIIADFEWNKKRNVQTLTTNKVVMTTPMSPKEVITTKGNRVQMENVIDSLCVAVLELIEIQEQQAHRIEAMYGEINAGRTPATPTAP